MFYLSTIRIFSLRICKLFLNSLLNFLSIVVLYLLFLFRQISLINVTLLYFLFFSHDLPLFSFLLPWSLRQGIMWIDLNDDINRLYLEPWSITIRFCSSVLSNPLLYLRFTTVLWSRIHYSAFSSSLVIATVLLPSHSYPLQKIAFYNPLFQHVIWCIVCIS